jgi:two-component system, NarL family, response regulator DesR
VIGVLVAEDMQILRDTLVAVLNLEAGIEIVAQVPAGEGIVSAAVDHHPDQAVIDIDPPGVDGLTAAGQLHRRLPSGRVLI